MYSTNFFILCCVVLNTEGDGWQSNKLYFTTADMTQHLTLTAGFFEYQSLCLPPGTYFPFACGGLWPSEVLWEIPAMDIFGGADDTCVPGADTHASFVIGK
jgi:hypothetical protein